MNVKDGRVVRKKPCPEGTELWLVRKEVPTRGEGKVVDPSWDMKTQVR